LLGDGAGDEKIAPGVVDSPRGLKSEKQCGCEGVPEGLGAEHGTGAEAREKVALQKKTSIIYSV
jgi:hypothetical protein